MNKTEMTAWLLPICTRVVPELSTMVCVEDQECVIAFYRDGSMRRIPTPGEGLKFLEQVIAGLEEEHGIKS